MKNDPSIDRRILRTRLVIRAALAELIEEKGFDGLTVKDITTRANINRGTDFGLFAVLAPRGTVFVVR